MDPRIELNDTAAEFVRRLLARHPEWAGHLRPYHVSHPHENIDAGSVWLEILDPDRGIFLTALVQRREALLTAGAAERLFLFTAEERDAALDEVVAAVERTYNVLG